MKNLTLRQIAEKLRIIKPNSRVNIAGLLYYYDESQEGESASLEQVITAYLPRTLEHTYTYKTAEQFMSEHGFESLQDLNEFIKN